MEKAFEPLGIKTPERSASSRMTGSNAPPPSVSKSQRKRSPVEAAAGARKTAHVWSLAMREPEGSSMIERLSHWRATSRSFKEAGKQRGSSIKVRRRGRFEGGKRRRRRNRGSANHTTHHYTSFGNAAAEI